MGTNPSKHKGKQNPVEQVTWTDAVEFCRRLSAISDEKKANRIYRLPTEAEWEYVCRAGSKSLYCYGNDSSRLSQYAWYGDNASKTTHPVGQKMPNAWGLYDLHGNVWEWCLDWYDPAYFEKSSLEDPGGPTRTGENRVIRGNCYLDAAVICSVSHRGFFPPKAKLSTCQGFRIVCTH